MATPDRRAAFLADEADARLTWDFAVEAVPRAAVAEPVADERSAKDIVAHIAGWERWGSERLAARQEGRSLPPIPEWEPFEHGFNEALAARWRDASWDAVQAEAAASYAAFRAHVESLTDEQLFGERGSARMIRACGSEHYAGYIPRIRDLVERQPLRTSFETTRLRLRSFRPSDAPFQLEMFSDPAVMRYIPPPPLPITAERARRATDRRIASEQQNGFALWLVERKDTGAPIGECGLTLVEKKGPEVEIAYVYHPSAWGHGFGTEAAVACLSRGFDPLGLQRIFAFCYGENTASWRVMEKAGMHGDGMTDHLGIRMKRYIAEKSWWRPPR